MSLKVASVVVTRDRPAQLARCLQAIWSQQRRPDLMIVVDNGSRVPVQPLLSHYPGSILLRLCGNPGPAAAFGRGISRALTEQADMVWLMDDDGVPADCCCLGELVETSRRENAALVSPLVCNINQPERLAFPIRRRGRTRFSIAELDAPEIIEGFAHLFNGALIQAATFQAAGLPDARLFIRGDEVEFMLRLRRRGLRILTDPSIAFLHPSSDAEIRPILGGRFYAVVPNDELKRFHQFRNRGWIFARYGMWGWLAADHVRYACWYLVEARDPAGYARWLTTTWTGVMGHLDTHPALLPEPALESAA